MTTTRKDLERIAFELAAALPLNEAAWGTQIAQWSRDVKAVADALEVTCGFDTNGNRRFKRDRFYAACGVTEGEG